jgi:hypothetical protein
MRCGRTPGGRVPACGSGHERRWPPRWPNDHLCATRARRRSPACIERSPPRPRRDDDSRRPSQPWCSREPIPSASSATPAAVCMAPRRNPPPPVNDDQGPGVAGTAGPAGMACGTDGGEGAGGAAGRGEPAQGLGVPVGGRKLATGTGDGWGVSRARARSASSWAIRACACRSAWSCTSTDWTSR